MSSDLVYAAQLSALLVWLDTLDADDLAEPSSLPGWTVADLIAHLCGTGDLVAGLERVDDPGAVALSVAEYVSGYGASAEQISGLARRAAEDAGPEVRKAFAEAVARGEANLAALGAADPVVRSRRGPILLSTFLDTRLVELVVHADDLGRSLPHRPAPPVLGSARRRVVTVLREVLTERAEDPAAALAAASTLSPAMFVDLATGRLAPSPELPAALARAVPVL